MKVVKNIDKYSSSEKIAMSLGMFDGVHIGHQKIIEKLKYYSKSNQLDCAIMTFWPHPRTVLQTNSEIKLLNTIEEKQSLLKNLGVEILFLQDFDEQFRSLTGEEFVKNTLLSKLHMKYMIIGYDHHFGKNKSGDFRLLKNMSIKNDFKVESTPVVLVDGIAVSSTKIRNALLEGDISLANKLLGYHYNLSGTVVHGKKIGRKIGYPTANLDVNSMKLLPMNGAYIVDVLLDENKYMGMLSIGTNPTVNGTKKTVEVYILDFNSNIYGDNIKVCFRDFLHNEIKFESIEKLIARLDEDKILTRKYFENEKNSTNPIE